MKIIKWTGKTFDFIYSPIIFYLVDMSKFKISFYITIALVRLLYYITIYLNNILILILIYELYK